MQPALSAGKHANGAKRGKICNPCQARENMQPVSSAGKYATDAKRGKTCNRCQARENMQSMPSAGKHATGAKRGEQSTGAKRGKFQVLSFVVAVVVLLAAIVSLAVTTEGSIDEGWDTEDVEIPDEDLLASDAKTLMDEVKAGHVEELQVPTKVS